MQIGSRTIFFLNVTIRCCIRWQEAKICFRTHSPRTRAAVSCFGANYFKHRLFDTVSSFGPEKKKTVFISLSNTEFCVLLFLLPIIWNNFHWKLLRMIDYPFPSSCGFSLSSQKKHLRFFFYFFSVSVPAPLVNWAHALWIPSLTLCLPSNLILLESGNL